MFEVNSGLFQTQESLPESSRFSNSIDWCAKGEKEFAEGNYKEACQYFERALQNRPFDAKAHNNLSVAHWQQGHTEEALESLTRALELDPNDQDVILNCSMVFSKLGKQEYAREILQAYLERNPWDKEARIELDKLKGAAPKSQAFDPAGFFNQQGEEQFAKGRKEHAKVCFEMALEHNPHLAKACNNLGVLYWENGDLETALEYLYRALDIDSEDPDIMYNCSKALLSAGEHEAAADLMKLYLQRNPQEDAVWEEYSSLLLQMGSSAWKPDGLSSEVADIYIQMGLKLSQLQDYSGASEAYERAFLINPDRNDACYLLGCLHLELGQKDEALEIMRAGLKPGDHHKKTVLTMGDILISLERFADARMLFDDYLADNDGDQDILEALAKL